MINNRKCSNIRLSIIYRQKKFKFLTPKNKKNKKKCILTKNEMVSEESKPGK